MKSLDTLIKLHKNNLDTIIKLKKSLEDKKDSLVSLREELSDLAKAETSKYYGTDYAYMLEQFMEKTRKQQHEISGQIDILEKEITLVQDKLFDEFSELKKIEIAKNRKLEEEKLKNQKIETSTLDEYSIGKFVRKT